jgi:hypothetical protein
MPSAFISAIITCFTKFSDVGSGGWWSSTNPSTTTLTADTYKYTPPNDCKNYYFVIIIYFLALKPWKPYYVLDEITIAYN